jgi:uncharacterized BrkB/YihY/UPF0761 family membrane protein
MEILNILVPLLISFLFLIAPVAIVVGIVLAVKAKNQQDPSQKKSLKTWAIWLIAGPIVLIFLTLSLWGLVTILSGTATP